MIPSKEKDDRETRPKILPLKNGRRENRGDEGQAQNSSSRKVLPEGTGEKKTRLKIPPPKISSERPGRTKSRPEWKPPASPTPGRRASIRRVERLPLVESVPLPRKKNKRNRPFALPARRKPSRGLSEKRRTAPAVPGKRPPPDPPAKEP